MAALILALALVVVVCASCAKKEETESEVTFRIKNGLMDHVAIVTLRDKNSTGKRVWSTTNMVPDQQVEVTFTTILKNDTPNFELKFTTEFGDEFSADINEKGNIKTIVITMEPNNPDKVIAQISNE